MKNLKNTKGFTLMELLVVIGILGVIMFIFFRGFNFGATANDYANDMSLDIKGLSTNVFKQLKAQDPWDEMATSIDANNTWVNVSDYTLKSDGTTPFNPTERLKLGVYAKQFDGSIVNIKKWSSGFEKPVKFKISSSGPSSDGINMQGKAVVKNSVSNNTTSVLEICMAVNTSDVTLPAGHNAICVLNDMGSSTTILTYTIPTMP